MEKDSDEDEGNWQWVFMILVGTAIDSSLNEQKHIKMLSNFSTAGGVDRRKASSEASRILSGRRFGSGLASLVLAVAVLSCNLQLIATN